MGESKYTILIVDDEFQILNALERHLTKNYQVYKANTSEKAKEILQNKDIPLVIIDYNLEEPTTGIDFAIQLKELYPLMQVMMLTGEHSMDTIISALNSGAIDAFLNKPVKTGELNAHIMENLEIWENRKQIIDDAIEQLKQGKALSDDKINKLSVRTPLLFELLKASIELVDKTVSLDLLGIIIAEKEKILFQHLFEETFYIKHERLFAGFIQTIINLNIDIFKESQQHQIEELSFQDIKLFIRTKNKLIFTVFMMGEAKDKAMLVQGINDLVDDLSGLTYPTSWYTDDDNHQTITQKLIGYRGKIAIDSSA
ncbi:MAG: response regulator [Candidatus Kariarchaeaceae archaeon]|jgi:DNA-binding response OmpR family regulator